jgi:hypothetical protein
MNSTRHVRLYIYATQWKALHVCKLKNMNGRECSHILSFCMLVTFLSYISYPLHSTRTPGHAVTQLVEALRYKLECRRFDPRWYHWNFSLTSSFRPHYGPGVD